MPRRVVVIGPPCGGKTTYIAEHKQPGDVVIDMDRMASALAGDDEVTYDHPEHIIRLAAAAHFRVRKLVGGLADVTVWIIHAHPTRAELDQYTRIGAEVVTIDPGRDVVTERCSHLRPAKAAAWVDEWYAVYPEEVSHGV